MANYLITRIPDEKMKYFKTACAYFKITMKDTFLHVIDLTIIKHLKLTGSSKDLSKLLEKEE